MSKGLFDNLPNNSVSVEAAREDLSLDLCALTNSIVALESAAEKTWVALKGLSDIEAFEKTHSELTPNEQRSIRLASEAMLSLEDTEILPALEDSTREVSPTERLFVRLGEMLRRLAAAIWGLLKSLYRKFQLRGNSPAELLAKINASSVTTPMPVTNAAVYYDGQFAGAPTPANLVFSPGASVKSLVASIPGLNDMLKTLGNVENLDQTFAGWDSFVHDITDTSTVRVFAGVKYTRGLPPVPSPFRYKHVPPTITKEEAVSLVKLIAEELGDFYDSSRFLDLAEDLQKSLHNYRIAPGEYNPQKLGIVKRFLNEFHGTYIRQAYQLYLTVLSDVNSHYV